MTLFKNRIFAGVILRWALILMTGIDIRRPCEEMETHREKSHMKTEAVIGVMHLQAKELQGLQRTHTPSEHPKGTNSAHTLISDLGPPEL